MNSKISTKNDSFRLFLRVNSHFPEGISTSIYHACILYIRIYLATLALIPLKKAQFMRIPIATLNEPLSVRTFVKWNAIKCSTKTSFDARNVLKGAIGRIIDTCKLEKQHRSGDV